MIEKPAVLSNVLERAVRALRRAARSDDLSIITYHAVTDRACPLFSGRAGFAHSSELIADHAAFLARRYRPIRLSDAIDAWRSQTGVGRAAVVMFDDGYAGSLRVAASVLQRHGIPTAVSVVTGVIDNTDLIWRDKLHWLLSGSHGERTRDAVRALYRAAGVETSPAEPIMELTRRVFLSESLSCLLDELLARAGTSGPALAERYRPYVTSEELGRADPRWVEIVNHTHGHPVMAGLPLKRQIEELETARAAIVRWTGRAPRAFAIPFGLREHYDDTTLTAAAATGHTAMLDLRRRGNHAHRVRKGVLELSRFPAPVDGSEALARVMTATFGKGTA